MSASANLETVSDAYSGNILQGVAIAFIILGVFFVGLRYVSRYIKGLSLGLDDFLILPALIFNITLCGISIGMVQAGGIGRHYEWVLLNDPTALTIFGKLQIPFSIAWELAVAFPKLAVLGLYLRIFVDRKQRISTYVLIAVLVSFCISQVLATCLQCFPLSYLWDPTAHPGGHCLDFNTLWRWGSFPNIVTDIFMLILPLPCLLKLHLSTRDKIGLVATFCTGSIGLVTSIIRFATFYETNELIDPTWSSAKLGCISIVEASVYLIAACLPTFRPLLTSFRSHVGLSTIGSRVAKRDTSQQYLSGHSKHAKGYDNGSLDGFKRLANEEQTIKDNSSADLSGYEMVNKIRVKQDFVMSTTRITAEV